MRRSHLVTALASALVAATTVALAAPSPVQAVTLTPTLSAPTNGSTVGRNIAVSYSLPEAPMAGSVKLVFTSASPSVTCTITMSEVQSVSFTLDSADVLASPTPEIAASNCSNLPSATYSLVLQYRNVAQDPVAQSSTVSVTVDNVTQTPTLLTQDGTRTSANLTLNYLLPETPSAVSVRVFDGTHDCVLTMTTAFTVMNTVVNLDNPTLNSRVTAATTDCLTLPDGVYTVEVSYRDVRSNAAATDSASNVVLDTTTQTPTISAPAASSRHSDTIPLDVAWPEAALESSVTVTFDGVTDVTLELDGSLGEVETTISTDDPGATPGVQRVSPDGPIPDGTYTVRLEYQDDLGNPAASASSASVTIDTVTQTPTLTAPATESVHGPSFALEYTLPETPAAGSVTVQLTPGTCTLTMSDDISVDTVVSLDDPAAASGVVSSSCADIASGTYDVTLSYRDDLSNPASTSTAPNVLLARTPGTPAAPTATPGSGRVTVVWSAPTADAATATTDYVVRVRPFSSSTWTEVPGAVSTTRSATITGLMNGTRYVVQVAAVNAVGRGAWSASSASVTPRTVPSQPAPPTATLRRGKVRLTWVAPTNGGAPITDYTVQYRKGSGRWTTATDGVSARTSATLTLPRGSYRFRVTALNAAGASRASNLSSALSVPS